MKGYCHLDYSVDYCNECPRYMDDCDGEEEHILGDDDLKDYLFFLGGSVGKPTIKFWKAINIVEGTWRYDFTEAGK